MSEDLKKGKHYKLTLLEATEQGTMNNISIFQSFLILLLKAQYEKLCSKIKTFDSYMCLPNLVYEHGSTTVMTIARAVNTKLD